MNETLLKRWLDAYGSAWQKRDPHAAAELYAEDGSYQVTPFLRPMKGREAIRAYWVEVAQTEEGISFGYEILAVTEQFGIAHWHASFNRTPPGLKTKLDGIFAIQLDAMGKCTSLREWWHKQQ
ncbi:MAG TPA: nuclear transport factor 2 family protein [Candidatus Limnocylindrales bacterium]|nr:nuclear transport factor 2 family protein [Candidatus Limnocylindrales bacterium]